MADIVDAKTRSRMMRGIRGKDTKPELAVRSYLHTQGFRFRIHPKNVPGKPDLVLPRYRAAIFVHGCFWHRHKNCRLAYNPRSRIEFWQAKFNQNVARDKAVVSQLIESGWRVMIIWECALRDCELRERGLEALTDWIYSSQPQSEFPLAGRLPT